MLEQNPRSYEEEVEAKGELRAVELTTGGGSFKLTQIIERAIKYNPVPDGEVPTDLAKNYKHYLYGWPKEDGE